MKIELDKINKELEELSSLEIISWAIEQFKGRKIKLSTSFGVEGIVVLDLLQRIGGKFEVFTIDTGRNFNETYEIWDSILKRYNININVYAPDADDLSKLCLQYGPNLFYESIEQRKKCCYVRKVKPLCKALLNTDLWITGLRRQQSKNRDSTQILSWNETHGIYKLCPIAKWSEENVWEYTRNNNIPYHALYNKGFFTIGCQPCTRQGRPAESQRSCRWWWENDEHKECGIHFEDGKIVRNKDSNNWII